MSRLANALDLLHRFAARYKWTTLLAIKLRNQCQRVVGHRVAESCKPNANGEFWLLHALGGRLRVVVDVGANVGEWTAMALAENPELERAVLLEPDERNISQLRVRFANRAPVVLRAEVASSAAGYRTFYVAQDCTIGSCVPPAEGRTDVLAAREVKAVTIDDLLGDLGLDNVDFLKVDTEGHDFDVVLGAARQLSQRRLGVIQFEYGADYVRAGRTLTCFRRMLAGYGYKVFLLGPRGLRDVDHDLLGEHFSYSNYVALRADFVDLLGPSIERSRV